jgi:glycosyltransferase involved in cell wall biosynthesis
MSSTASVILPTYNRAKTLPRAIDSVLSQTFIDFELIIVDDGSTDTTADILRQYEGHEKVHLFSQANAGCASARNLGLLNSRGRYLAFQDSDDEWLPTRLEEAVKAFENTGPDVGVVYGDMIRVAADQTCTTWKSPEVVKGILIDEDRLDYQVAGIGMCSSVIKRECFDKVGPFDQAMPRFSDLEFFIRASEHFEFLYHPTPLVKYYAGPGISTNIEDQVIARRYLIEKYNARLSEHKPHMVGQFLYLEIAKRDLLIKELENELKACRTVSEAQI